jgi:hypothetical protein
MSAAFSKNRVRRMQVVEWLVEKFFLYNMMNLMRMTNRAKAAAESISSLLRSFFDSVLEACYLQQRRQTRSRNRAASIDSAV